ncbi:hypothetical protein, partial [Pseudomonas carnis]
VWFRCSADFLRLFDGICVVFLCASFGIICWITWAKFVLPWEDKLCPGNPADDPETGAEEYNAYAIKKAQEVGRATKPD